VFLHWQVPLTLYAKIRGEYKGKAKEKRNKIAPESQIIFRAAVFPEACHSESPLSSRALSSARE